MHLASRAVATLYDSLRQVCPDVPSRAYVESLMRMAGLLHDVGHGPFGHFLDEHFLSRYRPDPRNAGQPDHSRRAGRPAPPRAPQSQRPAGARRDARPGPDRAVDHPPQGGAECRQCPRWLALLRSLFSGIYTVDNMDFVLRDAYMSGYSTRAFDLERLLHYSFFTPQGLTIHSRGVAALVRFMSVRAELFRTVYFHRTVRAIDLTLADLFAESKDYLFPGNPLEHLDALPAVHRMVAAGRRGPLGRVRRPAEARAGPPLARPAGPPHPLEDGLPAEPRVRRLGNRAEQHFQPARLRRARTDGPSCPPSWSTCR